MDNRNCNFTPLTLRPHWAQLVINKLHYIILCVAAFITALLFPQFIFRNLLFIIGTGLLLYLAYQVMYLARMKYVVTDDQIIYLHGVINHATDYMELYRVIDYQQQRTLMQQLAGLKTVVIFSGDHNTPVMTMVGVKEQNDVVREIRKRVEHNKKEKHIYEITNRI